MRIHNQPQGTALVAKCQPPTARILILARLAKGRDLSALHPGARFCGGQTKCLGEQLRVHDELFPLSLDAAHA